MGHKPAFFLPNWARRPVGASGRRPGCNETDEYELKMQVATQTKESQPYSKVLEVIAQTIAPLGYEVVHLELQTHRNKILRLFIDRLEGTSAIGVEDCAKVSRALDEPLEVFPELDALFHGASYELEVSSPGVDRPLRTRKDFGRFEGSEARIHTFRPLTGEETGNATYTAKNPKQKNFLGRLSGLDGEGEETRVRVALSTNDGADRKSAPGKELKSLRHEKQRRNGKRFGSRSPSYRKPTSSRSSTSIGWRIEERV